MLARELTDSGHVVRGTTRDPARRAQIEAAGAEAVLADPDRIATLLPALEQVSVVCLLAPLRRERVEALLQRVIDTPVRGVVGGVNLRPFCERAQIRWAALDANPIDYGAWLRDAVDALERILRR